MGTGVGSVTVPVITLSAAGTTTSGVGIVTAPSVGVSGTGKVWRRGAVSVAAPTLSGSGARGRVGVGDISAPRPVVLAAGGNRVTVPAPTLVGTGVSGTVSIGDVQAPSAEVYGSAISGNSGTGDVRISVPNIVGSFGSYSDITTPVPTVAGVGMSGKTGVGSVYVPGPEISVTLTSRASGLSVGDVAVRPPAVYGSGSQTKLIAGNVSVGAPAVQGAGVSGNVGSANIQVPLVVVDAAGNVSTVGTARVTIPAPQVEGNGVTGVLAPVVTGISVNTRTAASSENTGLTINSMTEYAGVILAATSTGVVALTSGVTDDGTLIQASVSGGVSDFNSTGLKKVIAGYVSCRSSGELRLSLITDEKTERVYRLLPRQTGIHATKVRFGLGVSGRHWQWKLSNMGNSFDVNEMTIEVETLERRIF